MFHKLSIAFISLALMTGAAAAQEKSADVLSNKGDKIGTIEAKQGPHGVVLRISLYKGSLTTGLARHACA